MRRKRKSESVRRLFCCEFGVVLVIDGIGYDDLELSVSKCMGLG